MPADVLPSSYHTQLFLDNNHCDLEAKSGHLDLIGSAGVRQNVRVVVYRTSLEHFAVIYPRRRPCKPLAVVNLRHTSAEQSGSGFVVRQKGFDSTNSVRFVCAEREVDSWIFAFTSGSSACQSLPVLVEAEEN